MKLFAFFYFLLLNLIFFCSFIDCSDKDYNDKECFLCHDDDPLTELLTLKAHNSKLCTTCFSKLSNNQCPICKCGTKQRGVNIACDIIKRPAYYHVEEKKTMTQIIEEWREANISEQEIQYNLRFNGYILTKFLGRELLIYKKNTLLYAIGGITIFGVLSLLLIKKYRSNKNK